MALRHFTVATVPGHENSVLGLSLLHWLRTGRLCVACDAQYCYFKRNPLHLSGWVLCPAMGDVPLCCVLVLGQVGRLSRQALCFSTPAPGPNCGGCYPPTLPICGFKAAGQCKLCFLGPARLLLHSGMSVAPQSLLCCWLRQPLSPRGCSHGPGPTRRKDPPQKSGPGVCA